MLNMRSNIKTHDKNNSIAKGKFTYDVRQAPHQPATFQIDRFFFLSIFAPFAFFTILLHIFSSLFDFFLFPIIPPPPSNF